MILICCAVYDSAVQAFSRPFFVPHIGAATRGFTDEVNNPQSEISKHADDYILFELGEWDDANGKFIKLLDSPRQVTRGKDLVKVDA